MNTNIDSISIIRHLQALDLYSVTPGLLEKLFGMERKQVYRLLNQLKARELVVAVENGKYLVLGLEPERVLSNPLFIATQLTTPSYASYWSALHYYGYTEQAPRTVFVATTQKKRPVTFRKQPFRYVTIKSHKFFGYRREMIGDLPVLIADEAKSLVDSLDQSRYAGGMAEVVRSLAYALPDLNVELLIDYANHMLDRSLSSRLGYLLQRFGYDVAGLDVSASPVLLDPGGPAGGVYDKRWRVRNNLPDQAFSPVGIG